MISIDGNLSDVTVTQSLCSPTSNTSLGGWRIEHYHVYSDEETCIQDSLLVLKHPQNLEEMCPR